MTDQNEEKLDWAERRREKKRQKHDRTGDSPEKLAEVTRRRSRQWTGW